MDGVTSGGKHLSIWTYDGTALTARNNGANKTLSSGDGGYGNSGGKIGFSFTYLTGDIAAILVYNSVLSGSDISSVETYLNTKYPCF